MPNDEMESWLTKLDPELQTVFRKEYESLEQFKKIDAKSAALLEAVELAQVKSAATVQQRVAASAAKNNADDMADLKAEVAALKKDGVFNAGWSKITTLLLAGNEYNQQFWSAYYRGIDQFGDAITAATLRKIQTDDLSFFEKAVKGLATLYVDTLVGLVEGPVAIIVWTAYKSNLNNKQPAAKTAGPTAEDYIEAIKLSIDPLAAATGAAFDPQITPWESQFKAAIGKGGAAAGDAFVAELDKVVGVYKKLVGTSTSAYFEQQFATAFASVHQRAATAVEAAGVVEGMNEFAKQMIPQDPGNPNSGRETGTLYFRIYLMMGLNDEKKTFVVTKSSPQWKLVTATDNPDGQAKSLWRTAKEQKPWNIDLPKKVLIHIDSIFGYYSDWLTFATTNPDQYVFSPSATGAEDLATAWKDPKVRAVAVDNNKQLEGDIH